MSKHLNYLRYVLRHKWFVLLAAIKLGVPLLSAILHDWDKFLPGEWFPYVDYFYGKKHPDPVTRVFNDKAGFTPVMRVPEGVAEAFDLAWNAHQKRNKHHWQYWLLTPDQPEPHFWEQSHDGGMTHSFIADGNGHDVAIVYEMSIEWHKPNMNLVRQMVDDLRNTPVPLEMPDVHRREMLADWIGAGRALGKPDTKAWYLENRDNIVLHPATRAWIEAQLGVLE